MNATDTLASIDPTLIELGHGVHVDITRAVRMDTRTETGRHASVAPIDAPPYSAPARVADFAYRRRSWC